jgi:hypothetical protein
MPGERKLWPFRIVTVIKDVIIESGIVVYICNPNTGEDCEFEASWVT